MARILGIDYGTKRTGLAVTDPFQLIVTGLETVETSALIPFLEKYFRSEKVEKVVLGLPRHADGNFTYIKTGIDVLAERITKMDPTIAIDFQDESLTSVQAKDIILKAGVKKKKRRDKNLVDKVSAVLILQKYLNHI